MRIKLSVIAIVIVNSLSSNAWALDQGKIKAAGELAEISGHIANIAETFSEYKNVKENICAPKMLSKIAASSGDKDLKANIEYMLPTMVGHAGKMKTFSKKYGNSFSNEYFLMELKENGKFKKGLNYPCFVSANAFITAFSK